MGQRRTGRHHLGAGDDNAFVGFLDAVHIDIFYLLVGFIAVYRGIDQGVIQERHAFLRILVPVPGIIGIITEVFRVKSQGQHEAGLVVRSSRHPAIRQARPLGNRFTLRNHVFTRSRHFKIGVGKAAVAGIRTGSQVRVFLLVMQRFVQPRHHPGRITKGGVLRYVLNSLTIDPDFPIVFQIRKKFIAGVGANIIFQGFFFQHGAHVSQPLSSFSGLCIHPGSRHFYIFARLSSCAG